MLNFEWKKLFRERGMKISFFLLVLVMIVNGIGNTGYFAKFRSDISYDDTIQNVSRYKERLFHEFEGTEYSVEQLKRMEAEYLKLYDASEKESEESPGKYGPYVKYDLEIFGSVLEMMRYLERFSVDLSQTLENTVIAKEDNLSNGIYMDTERDKLLGEMIESYNHIRENVHPELCYSVSAYWYAFTESEGSNRLNSQLFLIFLCCLVSFYFTYDHENQLWEMTSTTINGYRKQFYTKCIVVFISVMFLTILSSLINAVILSIHYGSMWDALRQPIQLIYENEPFAQFCPFSITFGEYILLGLLMKFTAFCFSAGIMIFFSLLLRRNALAVSASALFLIGLLQFTLYVSQDSLIQQQKSSELYKIFLALRVWSPLSLLFEREYVSSYDSIFFFGSPVFRLSACMIISWGMIVILIGISAYIYGGRRSLNGFGIDWHFQKIWKKTSPESGQSNL